MAIHLRSVILLILFQGKSVHSIITPEQSADSVKIIEAEKKSIRLRTKIKLK